MKVIIHNALGKIFEDEAKEVILPGEDGEFSVMDFHQYSLYRLRAGQIKVSPRKASIEQGERRFPVKQGLANIAPDKVIVMVED